MPARLASVERAWESKILQMSREFAGWWLFFGGLSQINTTQHFYHLLRNRSCHQQSFSSKVLNITCYSCEEKLTFYRTLKRFSHMLLIQSANKTMQSRRFAKFKWHNFTASLYWLTKLDVHTRDSFPNIPHPWCYDFDLKWGLLEGRWWTCGEWSSLANSKSVHCSDELPLFRVKRLPRNTTDLLSPTKIHFHLHDRLVLFEKNAWGP